MLQRAENSEFNHFFHLFDGILFSLYPFRFSLLFISFRSSLWFRLTFQPIFIVPLLFFYLIFSLSLFFFCCVLLSTKRIEKVHTSRWHLNLQILNTRHHRVFVFSEKACNVQTMYVEKKRWSIFENGHFRMKGCTIVFLCKYVFHIPLHARFNLSCRMNELHAEREKKE